MSTDRSVSFVDSKQTIIRRGDVEIAVEPSLETKSKEIFLSAEAGLYAGVSSYLTPAEARRLIKGIERALNAAADQTAKESAKPKSKRGGR